jgi:formiminotetrahydrofolate cyclodeaminase
MAEAVKRTYIQDLESWLHDVANESLPGSVAAAAIAAAMGAALIAKAIRVTLQRQTLNASDRVGLEATLGQAQRQQRELVRLAEADEEAYREVLDKERLPTDAPARRAARQRATETPMRLAERCQSLLSNLPQVLETCWPAVRSEAKTGGWLLEVGVRAGLLAAEINRCEHADEQVGKE